jgi:hypothetical protein
VKPQSKKTVVQVVQDVLQKHFTTGRNLQKLATQITVVKNVEQQFKQNLHQVVQVVQVQHFTTGENFKTENKGGFATIIFYFIKNN